MRLFCPTTDQSVTLFSRFDYVNTQASVAAGLTPDEAFSATSSPPVSSTARSRISRSRATTAGTGSARAPLQRARRRARLDVLMPRTKVFAPLLPVLDVGRGAGLQSAVAPAAGRSGRGRRRRAPLSRDAVRAVLRRERRQRRQSASRLRRSGAGCPGDDRGCAHQSVRRQVDELPRLPPRRRIARFRDDRHAHLRRLRAPQPDPRSRRRPDTHAAQLAAAGERVARARRTSSCTTTASSPAPRTSSSEPSRAATSAWLPDERAQAVAHIARVIRADDGRISRACPATAFRTRRSSPDVAAIPEICRLPEALRLDVNAVSDEQLVRGAAAVVAAYMRASSISRTALASTSARPSIAF